MPAGEALKLTLAIYDAVSGTHGADMTGGGWATARRQRVAVLHNPAHDVEEDRGEHAAASAQPTAFVRFKPHMKPNAALRGFTCRRALVALYFSCKE